MLEAVIIRSYTNRDGEERTSFTKVGAAFPYRQGDGWMIKFDALPTSTFNQETGQNECVVHLRPPYDPDAQQGAGRGQGRAPARSSYGGASGGRGAPARGQQGGGRRPPRNDDPLDDEIPF
jgi:hypothetical protein